MRDLAYTALAALLVLVVSAPLTVLCVRLARRMRARELRRARARARMFSTLSLLAFGACAPADSTDTIQRHVGQGDLAGVLEGSNAPAEDHSAEAGLEPAKAVESAPPACSASPAANAPAAPDESTPDPILSLPAARCAGHWADNSDALTRFVAHPDTGLCTFSCRDPRCDTSWYSDARCAPAYTAHVALLCTELGGSCAARAAGGSYCTAGAP